VRSNARGHRSLTVAALIVAALIGAALVGAALPSGLARGGALRRRAAIDAVPPRARQTSP